MGNINFLRPCISIDISVMCPLYLKLWIFTISGTQDNHDREDAISPTFSHTSRIGS